MVYSHGLLDNEVGVFLGSQDSQTGQDIVPVGHLVKKGNWVSREDTPLSVGLVLLVLLTVVVK